MSQNANDTPGDTRSPLAKVRVLLEACPPAIGDREKSYAFLRQSFSLYNSFHAVSIPDLQDAGEFQRTRSRVPNDEFAMLLKELTEKPFSLYKVCATCTRDEFEAWLGHASRLGCRDIFLVGPDSTEKTFKKGALHVDDGARIAQSKGFRCGGIIIPTRRSHFVTRPASMDETERLFRKVRELGLKFFTTQILYEGEWMSCLLLDLVRGMDQDELPQIFLTFSPFVCAEDISFAKKTLGVYIPNDVNRMLRGARSMREASISSLLLVWERISTFAAEIGYPREKLGVNVEYLDSRNPRNVDAAFELAEEFGRQLKKR
jgi:5,10-methylenetetrahydrofolate reductase